MCTRSCSTAPGRLVLGAELPEAERNRLLRRVDWRFLLPESRVGRAVCYANGDLLRGLRLIAREVIAGGSQVEDCDLAAAIEPDVSLLRVAWGALRPGGTCYVEWSVGRGRLQAAQARLRAAGFDDSRAYLPWPSRARPYVWIPI